ncbi:ABC transporter ATP-binding protein [Ferrimonas pelagia]|uniref:ABC transporter ATP-binding protein n=1 Tax=Ferrimonas pelagia TaxID=1177826 RepID=A0ABP9EC23_9GAMM
MCIELHQLTLNQGHRTVVQPTDLHLHRGEKIGLIGPNGSGKTTLLKAIAGLHSPASGRISLDCHCLSGLAPQDLAQQMAILLQDQPTDLPLSVHDTIELAAMARPDGRAGPSVAELLAIAHLTPLAHTPVSRLSGGERQRVFLAQALFQAPQILLLDEPSNHLDVRHQWQLLQHCHDTIETVIASYHDFNLAAALCDRLILLVDGVIQADGPPQQVLTPANLKRHFGVDSERLSNDDDAPHIRVLGAVA